LRNKGNTPNGEAINIGLALLMHTYRDAGDKTSIDQEFKICKGLLTEETDTTNLLRPQFHACLPRLFRDRRGSRLGTFRVKYGSPRPPRLSKSDGGQAWTSVQDSLAYRKNRMDFSIRLVIEPLFHLFNPEP
jgi:hypothetical protein